MKTPEQWREVAQEGLDDARKLLESPDIVSNFKEAQAPYLIRVIVGHVHFAIADVLEAVQAESRRNTLQKSQLKTIVDRNNALRTAAATGDWEAFDKAVAAAAGGADSGAPE